MYRREQAWLEGKVHSSNAIDDYDRRAEVPLPYAGVTGPVDHFLSAFAPHEVLGLHTLDLSRDTSRDDPSAHHQSQSPRQRRAGKPDAAFVRGSHMLGEETASLIECVQQQQDIGRLTISFVDVSGASMDRVCFLVLKHFLKASQVKTMVAHCSRLTLVQFADLLDMLHETSVETLDVSGTDSSSLPVRSLAEFMARSPTLRTLVCDGISLNADDARHFIRGLLKNESIRCLSLNAVADGALGKMVTETELLFRSIRHHKNLEALAVANNNLSASQLQPLLQALRLKKGFRKLNLSGNNPALSQPEIATHIAELLKINETIAEIGVDGITELGLPTDIANDVVRMIRSRAELCNPAPRSDAAPLLQIGDGRTPSHETLVEKRKSLERDETLWRRENAVVHMALDEVRGDLLNAEHERDLMQNAVEETRKSQEVTMKECTELQAATALLQRRYNETLQQTQSLQKELQKQLDRNEDLKSKFRNECQTLEYAQKVREKLVTDREHLTNKIKAQQVFLFGQQKLLSNVKDANGLMEDHINVADAIVNKALKENPDVRDTLGDSMSPTERAALSGHPLEYFEKMIDTKGGREEQDDDSDDKEEGTSLEWELLSEVGADTERL